MAFQDSDDWSHPDRIGKSIAVLTSEPEIVALTTNWVRMTTQGDFMLKRTNRYSYKSCISLVFRRKEVLQRSGFFRFRPCRSRYRVRGSDRHPVRRAQGGDLCMATGLWPRSPRFDYRRRGIRTGTERRQASPGGIPERIQKLARGNPPRPRWLHAVSSWRTTIRRAQQDPGRRELKNAPQSSDNRRRRQQCQPRNLEHIQWALLDPRWAEGPCSPRDEVCRTVALPAPMPGVEAVAGGMPHASRDRRPTGACRGRSDPRACRRSRAGCGKRAAALAPVCDALSEADRRLSALPMAGSAAAGPPWGLTEGDGEH